MRKIKKPRNRKIREKKITKIYFGLGGVLVLVLVVLLLFNAGVFEPKHEIQKFSIDDECSIIMGNIIHNVGDDGDCKIKCENNCEIRSLKYHDSNFVLENSSCHTCDCYCV